MALDDSFEGELAVEPGEDEVTFRYTVTNVKDEPVDLQFSDAGKADVAVLENDEEIWRFTDGRAFAMVISTEEVGPGEQREYELAWGDPEPGSYTAVAELRATTETAEARAEFEVD